MYKNLVEIGLKKYLDKYFFNQTWFSESYLEKLNSYIGSFTNEQKTILKKKYSKISNHMSVNDHFYELMVGYVFHPNGLYLDDNIPGGSPDMIDNNVMIEIKAINAPPAEIERVKTIDPNSVSWGPLPDDNGYESRFTKKFNFRISKARQQVSNKGIIYIIWDSTLKGMKIRKPMIESLLNNLSKSTKSIYPNIEIKPIYFEDLQKMVNEQNTSIETL